MARILVCDDDEGMRNFVARALQLDGHLTQQAYDGAHAVEILSETADPFDLLLTDIRMPVMDGVALAAHCAQRHPTTIILMMTGFADERDTARGLGLAIREIIMKPFSLAAIRSKVRDALSSAKDRPENSANVL